MHGAIDITLKMPKEDSGKEWLRFVEETVDMLKAGQMTIRHKERGLMELKPNGEQQAVLDRILRCAELGIPFRCYVLKSRQVGISTIIAAFIYVFTSIAKGRQGLVCAHDSDGCNALWKMYLRYKEHDERQLRMNRHSRRELEFKGMDSGVYVTVADADIGRGDSIQLLHGSEYGFWKNPEEALETILSCVPDGMGSFVALESTGNPGTDFEDRFRSSWKQYLKYEEKKKNLISNWTGMTDGVQDALDELERKECPLWFPFFFPWFMHRNYKQRCDPSEHREILNTYDEDERLLLDMGVKPDQIKWRRWAIENKYGGKTNRFKSQMPATVDEAFSSSMDTWFDKVALSYLKKKQKKPKFRCEITLGDNQVHPIISEEKRGRMRVYEVPITGHEYVVGGDAAGESSVAVRKDQKSETAMTVIDATAGEIVACWSGSINAHEFGDVMVAAGYYYNLAMLVPEAEQHGWSTTFRIAHGLRYPRVYTSEKDDRLDRGTSDRIGWRQSEPNRIHMLDIFQRLVKEYKITVPDEVLISQMFNFVKNQKGKYRARAGSRDDLVIATGIALAVASEGRAWGVKDRNALKRAQQIVDPRLARDRRKRRDRMRPEDYGTLFMSSRVRKRRNLGQVG